MKKGAVLLLTLSLFGGTIYADQTGDCTAGSQYCEQNSLETTNTTTTTNNSGYGYYYDFVQAYANGVILPPSPQNPGVFELKNPKQNIRGVVL